MSRESQNPTPAPALRAKAAATGRRKGEKPELQGRPTTGRITRIVCGQGHGFIRASDGREVFFHRSDVSDYTFNDLTVDDRVGFEVLEDAVTGPRATKVRKTRRR
jgi:cold shock CspA family protein